MRRPLFTLLPGVLLLGALLQGAGATERLTSCHIHPPGSTPENPFGLIGPFDSPAECEQERARRFGPAGRCHCAADFTPRWLPPALPQQPGDSPLG